MMQPPTEHIRTMLPPAVLVGMVIVIGLYDPTFFSLSNFETVISDTMSLFLMATGLTLVIMMGGIDLSVQAVASMASCILAAYLPRATAKGCMAIISSSDPSQKSVAPFGGRQPLFTPDPVAVGIPTDGDPILVDTSASITTNNMGARLAREGRRFPGRWSSPSRPP